jgi:hypothetical protein
MLKKAYSWDLWPAAMGPAAHTREPRFVETPGVRHPELLPLFATAIAMEIVHLRWIMLTQWTCRGCHASHMECDCKYGWLKRLL